MSHAAGLPASIVIVRHGETEWSAIGRHTGRTDLPLTAVGEREAVAAGPVILDALGGQAPTAVYSSPLQRARRTTALALGVGEPIVDERLAEVDYGRYESLTSDAIRHAQPGWDLWAHGAPDGESVAHIAQRCDAFIDDLRTAAAGGRVVLVSHGHLGRALTARLLGWDVTAARSLHSDTASVGLVTVKRDVPVLAAWNRRPAAG